MSSVERSYSAIGPTVVAFETLNNQLNSNQTFGVSVTGSQCGVYGESTINPNSNPGDPPVTRPPTTDVPSHTGVAGKGESYGVLGSGTQTGVFGVGGRVGVDGDSSKGLGLRGHSFENDGVVGHSDSQNRSGVFGFNSQLEGNAFGVSGTSRSSQGAGVFGFGTTDPDTAACAVGVVGHSESNDGVVGGSEKDGRSGVFGFNNATAFGAWGVSGTSKSPQGAGIFGFAPRDRETGLSAIGILAHSDANDGVVGGSDSVGRSGVYGFNTNDSGNAFGVSGQTRSSDGAGVFGFAETDGKGVLGYSPGNDGIVGLSEANGKSGVFGFNSMRSGAAFGVFGRCNSIDGAGVAADNARGHGIKGLSSGAGTSGVFGENPAKPGGQFSGPGIESIPAGVTGKADQGIGVVGRSANSVGVRGLGGTYGGVFEGARAPLHLVPSVSGVAGAPTSGFHRAGELFVDSEGGLFFCVTTGTPGAWKRVQLVDP